MKNAEQGKREIAESRVGRLFFALWPDAEVARSIEQAAQLQHRKTGGRLMRRETLHMTLLFLGAQSLVRLPQLRAAAGAVQAEYFVLWIDRVAGWRHNRLAYAAPAVTPQALFDLVNRLRDEVGAVGFEFDGKAFKPHVTLLRNVLATPEGQEIQPIHWEVTAFVLVQSVPSPAGASYQILDRWPLKGPGLGLTRS